MKLPISIKIRNKITPSQIIILGFLSAIIIGTILLKLPISHAGLQKISWFDAFFTSTSAVCVNGLLLYDNATTWSGFGQGIILLLVQIGGLGIMFLFSVFALITKKKINLKERLTMQEAINSPSLSETANMFLQILAITLSIEFIGAILLLKEFYPIWGVKEGIWKSVFLSVSAFCNAGFDILGTKNYQFQSVVSLANNTVVLMTLALLVIIGGLGFVVWKDIWENKFAFRKYTLHSKIVLISTGILLVLGTALFFVFESDNPSSIGNMPLSLQLVNSFFNSASPRTAGFSSINGKNLTPSTNLLTIILMIIGGAPGSTAGGIKVTTFSILILTAIFFMMGKEDVQVMKNNIPHQTIFKSMCIFLLALLLISLGTFVILSNNNDIPFFDALYEASSAFSTSGMSTGITPTLNTLSKCVLILMMFLGRIGPLTMVIAFSQKQLIKKSTYKYSDGKISVG